MPKDLEIPMYMMGADNSDLELMDLGAANATQPCSWLIGPADSMAKPEDLVIPMYVMGTDFADPEMLDAEATSATQAFLATGTGT